MAFHNLEIRMKLFKSERILYQTCTLLITEIVRILPNKLTAILTCTEWTPSCCGHIAPNLVQHPIKLWVAYRPIPGRVSEQLLKERL